MKKNNSFELFSNTAEVWFSYLIGLGGSSLHDLNVFLADEAAGRQVVQDTLNTPQAGHQQLSVVGEDVKARDRGFVYLTHPCCSAVRSVDEQTAEDRDTLLKVIHF